MLHITLLIYQITWNLNKFRVVLDGESQRMGLLIKGWHRYKDIIQIKLFATLCAELNSFNIASSSTNKLKMRVSIATKFLAKWILTTAQQKPNLWFKGTRHLFCAIDRYLIDWSGDYFNGFPPMAPLLDLLTSCITLCLPVPPLNCWCRYRRV